MSHPADHAAYLAKHDFGIPPGDFTPAERDLLARYGRWMEALVSGALAPTTPSQEQFLRAARGEAEPRTDFERAWAKVVEARAVGDEVVRAFQTLSEARKRAAALEAAYREARQKVLEAVREQLDAVDARFAEEIQGATDDSAAAEKAVRELVLKLERGVKLAGIGVTFHPGRVTYDPDKMAAYAMAHPEVDEFRKTGKPWVSVRFGDGAGSSAAGKEPAVSESGEGRPDGGE